MNGACRDRRALARSNVQVQGRAADGRRIPCYAGLDAAAISLAAQAPDSAAPSVYGMLM